MPKPRLGRLIAQLRRQRGLSQLELARPEFSAAFIAALERAAISPSLLTLDLLARKLSLEPEILHEAAMDLAGAPDPAAIGEDIRFQANFALGLVREDRIAEGTALLDAAEAQIEPVSDLLTAAVRYLVPYVRARACYQRSDYAGAVRHLQAALQLSDDDLPAQLAVHNLLGAAYFEQERPDLALEEHQQCLAALINGQIKDLNRRLSIHQNLALDYLTLRDLPPAIHHYRAALKILHDLNDPLSQAAAYRGLLLAYQASGDLKQAKTFGLRALRVYEAHEQDEAAGIICLHLADILLQEARHPDAEHLLKRARWLLRSAAEPGVLSYLHAGWAELALRQGDLDAAEACARESLNLAEANMERSASTAGSRQEYPLRAYADALQLCGLVAEARDQPDQADLLFERAIKLIQHTGFGERKAGIMQNYANLLYTRGQYQRSNEYYRALADLRPRGQQGWR